MKIIHHPGYWMHETTGVLRPAVEAYWSGEMSPEHVAAMRAYLRQWIGAPFYQGEAIEELRRSIDGLTSHAAIRAWMEVAIVEGVDPL
ncbi:hypothetical protein ACC806_35050 [Rhizobium ruizarguesonis]